MSEGKTLPQIFKELVDNMAIKYPANNTPFKLCDKRNFSCLIHEKDKEDLNYIPVFRDSHTLPYPPFKDAVAFTGVSGYTWAVPITDKAMLELSGQVMAAAIISDRFSVHSRPYMEQVQGYPIDEEGDPIYDEGSITLDAVIGRSFLYYL